MTDMKRTTGGLFQGTQRTVTRGDLRDAVEFLDARVKDAAVRRVLGLDVAKRYANASSHAPAPIVRPGASEIQDLQRVPQNR